MVTCILIRYYHSQVSYRVLSSHYHLIISQASAWDTRQTHMHLTNLWPYVFEDKLSSKHISWACDPPALLENTFLGNLCPLTLYSLHLNWYGIMICHYAYQCFSITAPWAVLSCDVTLSHVTCHVCHVSSRNASIGPHLKCHLNYIQQPSVSL